MKKAVKSRKYFAPQGGDTIRRCDHPGCKKPGEYRAPKDKDLKEYFWFCLEHVQEYNTKWNYYEGISDQEPEPDKKPNLHFKGKVKYQFGGGGYEKKYRFFNEYADDYSEIDAIFYNKEEKRSLEVMGLSTEDLNLKSLKKQYKNLAKLYHPDTNQGDKAKEEKFKQLTHAYNCLLKKLS